MRGCSLRILALERYCTAVSFQVTPLISSTSRMIATPQFFEIAWNCDSSQCIGTGDDLEHAVVDGQVQARRDRIERALHVRTEVETGIAGHALARRHVEGGADGADQVAWCRAVRVDRLRHVVVGLVGGRDPGGEEVQPQHRGPAALDVAVERVLLLGEILELQLFELLPAVPGRTLEAARFRIGVVAEPAARASAAPPAAAAGRHCRPRPGCCRCRCAGSSPIT